MTTNECLYVDANPPITSSSSESANGYSLHPDSQSDKTRLIAPPKIPVNHFMGWLKEKMEKKEITLKFSYNECKYLKDFIKATDINKWDPLKPVFISAPTGAGKTTFIHETLVKILDDSNTHHAGKILLLSNRTALNRQNKYDAANRAIKRGNASYKKELDGKSPEISDRECRNFGLIDIYTYHQLFESHILNQNHYRYIVCDECHFFTSDSQFNTNTNEILREIVSKGTDSIRIYMSATPEVAFEAIIREEFAFLKEKTDNAITELQIAYNQNEPKRTSQLQSALLRRNILANNAYYIDPSFLHHAEQDVVFFSDESTNNYFNQARRQIEDQFSQLNVHFYYMKRNYNYIESIEFYDDYDRLAETMEASSSNKWMVFVHSKSSGIKLRKKLNKEEEKTSEKDSPAIFLFAGNRKEKNDTFNNITKEAKFQQQFLISTSVLDNGISIKDKNVRNIAINAFDRIELIQMLGRIRMETEDQKIKLFITHYSLDKLKSLAKQDALNLICRLRIDFMEPHTKMSYYRSMLNNQNYTRYDNNPIFITDDREIKYNPCAIYQLIDHLSLLLCIIRNNEPDYCIEFNDDDEAQRASLVRKYREEAGKDLPWSRSIIDLLGSKEDMGDRKEYQNEDLRNGIIKPRYEYTIHDSFLSYLYSDLIPLFLEKHIEEEVIQPLKSSLSDDGKRLIGTIISQQNQTQHISEHSCLEYWEIVATYLPDIQKKPAFNGYTEEVDKIKNAIRFYKNLAKNDICTPEEAQYRWVEKSNSFFKSQQEDNSTSVDSKKSPIQSGDINQYITEHFVTDEQIAKAKAGKYYDRTFLEKHGILYSTKNKLKELIEFSNKYLNGSRLKLYQEFPIDGKTYIVKSFGATKDHHTFYLFVLSDAH